jgi:hypothetical protein
MFRKDFFVDNDLYYDENRFFVEDYELWCRAFEKGMKVKAVNKVLCKHRWHEQSSCQNKISEQLSLLLAVKNIYNHLGIAASLSAVKDISPYKRKLGIIKFPRAILFMAVILTANIFRRKYSQLALTGLVFRRLKEAVTGKAF